MNGPRTDEDGDWLDGWTPIWLDDERERIALTIPTWAERADDDHFDPAGGAS